MKEQNQKIVEQALNDFSLKAWVWTADKLLVGDLELLDNGIRVNNAFIRDEDIVEIKFFISP